MKKLCTVAILALTGILPVASLAATSDSIWVSARVLQVRLDRIYLNHGRDECVFRNSRFVIHNGYDSIYSGCIEASYQGVSYSYPTDGLFDTIPTQSLHVLGGAGGGRHREHRSLSAMSAICRSRIRTIRWGTLAQAIRL